MRFFSAARQRRLPSYGALGQLPTARSPARAASSASSSASGRYQSRTVSQTAGRSSVGQVDPVGDDAVLDVVDGVGDVVGEVHDLRLEALPAPTAPRRIQSKTGRSSSYTPNLQTSRGDPSACTPCGSSAAARGQGYFVQASSVARVRLSPTEAPARVERSWPRAGSAAAASGRCPRSRRTASPSSASTRSPLWPNGGWPEVVGERGGLGDVGLAAQRPGQVAGDLGDLEAVGEPVADEVVALRPDHLGLGGQPPRGRGVHDPGPVALERRPHRRVDPLGRLLDEPLAGGVVVQRRGQSSQATLEARPRLEPISSCANSASRRSPAPAPRCCGQRPAPSPWYPEHRRPYAPS